MEVHRIRHLLRMKQSVNYFSIIKTNRYLIIIILLAVLVRSVVAFYLGNTITILPAIYDQFSYHSLALRLVNGFGFTFPSDWWPATRAGDPTAHWSYLYTIYLAIVYKIFGPNPLVARLIQAVSAGILMPWLAYRLTNWVFSGFPGKKETTNFDRTARFDWLAPINQFWQKITQTQTTIPLLAAAWTAFYIYFVYFAAALMTETFYIIAILWILDCAIRISHQSRLINRSTRGLIVPSSTSNPPPTVIDRNNLRELLRWLELGLAISITAMLRQVFLPFVPFLFLWMFWIAYRRNQKAHSEADSIKNGTRIGPTIIRSLMSILPGWLITGLIMIFLIAPITLFNFREFGRFVLLNTNAGYAFFWSNHPIYGNHYVSLLTDEMPSYYDLIPKDLLWMNEAALDNELLKRGIGFVVADPIRYIRLSIDRIPAYFIFWPLPSSSVFSNFSRVLSYGIAFPFVVAGILMWFLAVHRRYLFVEAGSLLLLFALIYSMIHLLSWAGIRYRLPVDSVTLIFAAYALYKLVSVVLFRKIEKKTLVEAL